ncbi:MAG: class I SAM-dependent methyltransferase [Acidobacteriales bacterium]|nr:class I SAM-dependent methyltransferase [Terriglobales bacterium]
MHTSVQWFIRRILTPDRIDGKSVAEIGSYNVNGSARDYVDVVCDASDILATFGKESFDVVISTEMLEHAQDWQSAISGMTGILKPGGLLLITARRPGFPLHSYPCDHWRFTVEDIAAATQGIVSIWLSDDTDPASPGIFYAGIKPPVPFSANPSPMA